MKGLQKVHGECVLGKSYVRENQKWELKETQGSSESHLDISS